MPATSPPIDRDQLTALQAGDERALERLLRDRFASLYDEAQAQVHDPGAARRVVETSILCVWDERARLDTPDALETFLHRTVRETAAREQSRLASLHRFDSHDAAHARKRANAPTPTADEAWSHVASKLHAPPPNHEAAVREAALHSRHAAAEHMAAVERRQIPVGALAIGAVLLALAGAGYWWANRRGEDARINRALASSDVRILSAQAAQQAVVTLDDGSKVTIGADSKLTVPPRFGRDVRAVKLDGAASFVVASGKEKPFVVRARNAGITATGTTFDVRAYDEDSAVAVRVREGSVTVKAGDASRAVAAGSAAAVAGDSSVRDLPASAVSEAFGWTDGRVVATNRPLRAVLPEMSRWYDVKLKVPDSTILDRRVTMSASMQSSREAIAAIEQSAGVKFGYQDKDMVLRDTAAARLEEAKAPKPKPGGKPGAKPKAM
jgi:ferric-dicitrate binding protein FerR (iron transport regulator)